MGEFINNEEMMKKSGKEYFTEIFKSEQKNYNDLKNVNNVDKILEKDSVDSVSKASLDNYKKMVDESDNAGDVKRFGKTFGGINNYLNANRFAKYSNLSTENALNKNYAMPLDEKGLKKLKGRMEDSKKTTGLFDKIHEQTKKYAIWMIILCALLPFAIPAMLAVGAVILAEYAVHEAVCQYEYNKVIKPLTVNGKNPYKNMLYSKGYKKLDELTAKQYKAEDVLKALIEAKENEKDPKKKEDLAKAIAKYVADNNIELSAEQSAKIGNAETNEVKGEQNQAEAVKEETTENGKAVPENAESPFNQDEKTKEAQEREEEIASENAGGQSAEIPNETLNEDNPEIVSEEAVEPANEEEVEDAERETGREQEFTEPTPRTEDEVTSESSEKDNSTKRTQIENFVGKSQDSDGIISDSPIVSEEESVHEEVEENNAINEADTIENEMTEQPAETNETVFNNDKVEDEIEENFTNVEDSSEENKETIEETAKIDDAKVVEPIIEEEQPRIVEQELSDDAEDENEQVEEVEQVETEEQNVVNADNVEPENVTEQGANDTPLINIDYAKTGATMQELKQSFNNNAEKLKSYLEACVNEDKDNANAKKDLDTLSKLSEVFTLYADNGNATVASSYYLTLTYRIEDLNANPDIECVFDANTTKNINDIYEEVFIEMPKQEAEKEKMAKDAIQAEKEKFDNLYQYSYAIMKKRDADLNNELSKDDLRVLQAMKNSYDYCFETGNYDICNPISNILYYVSMENNAMIEQQGRYFTNEMLRDLNIVNENIKMAEKLAKQKQSNKNVDEDKTL